MSVRRLAPEDIQPETFAFTADNAAWAGGEMAKYPDGRQSSAVIPLLWRAQEQAGGWLPRKAIEHVAGILGMSYIRVLEVATFYTMFSLAPVGRYLVQMCGTTPCQLRGSDGLKKVLHERIGPERHVTADAVFSWMEVECLGACCNAPMVQVNADYYEDLTPESLHGLLDDLAAGKVPPPGPQNGRRSSEPEGRPTTLTDASLYDGSIVGAWKKRFDQVADKVPAEPPAASTEAAANPEPAKPAATRAEQRAADSPAHRAVAGNDPLKPEHREAASPASAPDEGARQGTAAPPVSNEHQPALLSQAQGGKPDDLTLIRGVGPRLEAMLHRMGVFHFDQIAAWDDSNLRWVDQNLGAFKGRALRDRWIDQARQLAAGRALASGTAADNRPV